MFFRKNFNLIKWDLRKKDQAVGTAVVQVFALKLHEETKSNVYNDPASSDYIPVAVQLEGELLNVEGVSLERGDTILLVPYSELESLSGTFLPGDTLCLQLSEGGKCVGLAKVSVE